MQHYIKALTPAQSRTPADAAVCDILALSEKETEMRVKRPARILPQKMYRRQTTA
jgi:hypothetical protein